MMSAAEVESFIGGDDLDVILSSEDFSVHTDLGWAVDLAKRRDVRAILYLRRQDVWLMSWYNQHLKWPFSKKYSVMSPRQFSNHVGDFHWIDYKATVQLWQRAVGRENLFVRVVQPGEVSDVVADFFGLIKLDVQKLQAALPPDLSPIERINDSLPVAALETARHLGLIDLPNAKRARVVDALRLTFAGTGQYKTLYSASERKRILDRFRSSNDWVAQNIFKRRELFQEDDINDDAYLDLAAHPEFSLERNIASILRHAITNRTPGIERDSE